MHLFIFSVKIMYYLHKTTSAVSCVKPNASQWEATLRDDVGFATVYHRIYRRKFLTLSNQTSRYIRECIRISIIYAFVDVTKTRLHNFAPFTPTYFVKLGFTRVYIIFLISAQKHRLWVLVATATIYVLSRNMKSIRFFFFSLFFFFFFFYLKIFSFLAVKFYYIYLYI